MKKIIAASLLLSCHYLSCMQKLVDRNTFFKHVMGIDESDFKTTLKKADFIEFNSKENSFYIKNQTTPERYRAGKFTALSIKKLRELTVKSPVQASGTFNVVEALSPLGTSYYEKVDIGARQADPANRDAVFQVASNFNTLELTSSGDPMTNITGYVVDLTQGPFASISAAPGTILRHYYMFYKENTAQSTWQQYAVLKKIWQKTDATKQINLLENTDIPVVNSYVDFSERSPEKVTHYKAEEIQIGWHEGIQVTSGFMPTKKQHTLIDDPRQIINQIFTAAIDFGSNAAFKEDLKAIEIAQAVLDAAYEGTLRAASAHEKKKVILSLIGCGVFYNKLAWVANALEKMETYIKESGLEVTLIIFDGNDYRLTEQIGDFRNRMEQLAKNTGGEYIQYSKEEPQGKIIVKNTSKQKVVDQPQEVISTLVELAKKLETLTKVL